MAKFVIYSTVCRNVYKAVSPRKYIEKRAATKNGRSTDKDPPCHHEEHCIRKFFPICSILWNRKSANKPDDFEWIRKKEAAQVYRSAYMCIFVHP
jgi:hypothetical protein